MPAAKLGAAVSAKTKLFVLDTIGLRHDPVSVFRFDEHDVYLPMITLEELDNSKKGTTDVSRNARQVSREIDALATDHLTQGQGLSLAKTGRREARGSLFFQTGALEVKLPIGLPDTKNDNQILGVVLALRAQQPDRQVVLVSKDINVRIKARALGLDAEDYFNDKTLNDGDVLYTGYLALPANFWETHGRGMKSFQTREGVRYRVRGPLGSAISVNLFVYLEQDGQKPFYAKLIEHHGTSAVLQTLRDFSNPKNSALGVVAKSREQSFAMNMLMDPDCDFVTLAGNAGTGKTLMTPAAAHARGPGHEDCLHGRQGPDRHPVPH